LNLDNETYLRKLLSEQNLTENQKNNMRNLRQKIEQQLKAGLKGTPRTYYGGSKAKNTMIRASYDLDIVLYWPEDFQYTLESIYKGVGSLLQRNWNGIKAKRVGWEIPFPGNFHIDVIPGKESSTKKDFAYLYNSKTGSRFLTSIKTHVDHVRDSGRTDAIRLMKLWKKRKDVPIKTFILEMMVIDGCKGPRRDQLETQLNAALAYIRDNIVTRRIIDPVNTNNIVSDTLTKEEKNRIRKLAVQAIESRTWGEVFS